jgi:malonyl-CoA O-methyltransferase
MTERERFSLDKRLMRAAFEGAAGEYDRAAVLQREVGRRMLERLDLVRVLPALIVDAGAGTGHGSAALARRYRGARVLALDIAHAMLVQARGHAAWFRKQAFICADVERMPLTDAAAGLVFSNLVLQWCGDLDRVLREIHRVLQPGGLLMFSTFGPDTLRELRASWELVDDYNHVNAFMDMHDIGDALMRARFAGPVMDVERFTVTYAELGQLLRELKSLGAHNVTSGRRRTLSGKGRLQALAQAYERYRDAQGRLPASFEVVYGHAWASGALHRNGEVHVPVSRVRRR